MQITVQMTPDGLLINHPRLQEWLNRGVDIIQEDDRIIVQPKPLPTLAPDRERVLQILGATGLLVKPEWTPISPPVSDTEYAELAQKFSVGPSLSEALIKERSEGW